MSKPEIVLCAAVRTPIGTYGGALKDRASHWRSKCSD